MRAMLRITATMAVLVPLALLVAGSAIAVTITGASNQSDAYNTLPGATTNVVVGTAAEDPYCPGTMVMVRGTGFVGDGGVLRVSIGNVTATDVRVGSDSLLYAQVGAGATTGPVTVTTPLGTATTRDLPGGRISNGVSPEAQLPDYQIIPCAATLATSKVTISGVKPNPVKGGKKTLINGTGFLGARSVTIGGKKVEFAVMGDRGMFVLIPKTAANGKLTITITTAGGTTTSNIKLVKKA